MGRARTRRQQRRGQRRCCICLEDDDIATSCRICKAAMHADCIEAYARANEQRPLPCPQKCGCTLPLPRHLAAVTRKDNNRYVDHVEDPVTAAASAAYIESTCDRCPSCNAPSQLINGCHNVTCVCGRRYQICMPPTRCELFSMGFFLVGIIVGGVSCLCTWMQQD